MSDSPESLRRCNTTDISSIEPAAVHRTDNASRLVVDQLGRDEIHPDGPARDPHCLVSLWVDGVG